jgi:hypothetical protein
MLNLIGVNRKLELLKPGDFVGDAVRTQRMEVRRVYSREIYGDELNYAARAGATAGSHACVSLSIYAHEIRIKGAHIQCLLHHD